MKKRKIFEIDENSIIKATGNGYYYCCTIPPHKFGEMRGDRNKRYVYLHRAILEQKLNRYLTPDEQADHINGDKTDNRPSNLRILVRGPHQRSHAERGNHFWRKSPRNKPGWKVVTARNVLARFFTEKELIAGALFKEKYIPVKKLIEKKHLKAVIAKFSAEERAESLYQAFLENPAYLKMPKLFPKYNNSQSNEAVNYLMRAFEKAFKGENKGVLDRVRNKILAGIT